MIFDGQQLEDIKLVFDYNIQRESTVDLQLPLHLHIPFPNWIVGSINTFVKFMTGKNLSILVKGTDTIYNVKLRIYDWEGVPPGEHSKPGSEHNF